MKTFPALLLLSCSCLASASGLAEAPPPLVEARYLVSFSWLALGSPAFEIAPVEIECGGGAVPRLLEEETLHWCDCELQSETLVCSNFLPTNRGVNALNTHVSVACVGTPEDVLSISASMPETTYAANNYLDSLTRYIEIRSVSDILELDLTLRDDYYFPLRFPIWNHECEGPTNGGLMIGTSCSFSASCYDLTGSFAACSGWTLPKVTALATQEAHSAGSSPYFAHDKTIVLPELDRSYTVSYRVIAGYQESGCDATGDYSFTVQCGGGGGVLGSWTQLETCSIVDGGTIECTMPAAPGGQLLELYEDVTCTGSTVEQVAITATWTRVPLQCQQNDWVPSSLLRILTVYQLCPDKFDIWGPYADNIAPSCYPQTATYQDAISITEFEDRNNNGEQDPGEPTIDSEAVVVEFCSDAIGYACVPSCSAEEVQGLISEIKPQHVDLSCFDIDYSFIELLAAAGRRGGGTSAKEEAGLMAKRVQQLQPQGDVSLKDCAGLFAKLLHRQP